MLHTPQAPPGNQHAGGSQQAWRDDGDESLGSRASDLSLRLGDGLLGRRRLEGLGEVEHLHALVLLDAVVGLPRLGLVRARHEPVLVQEHDPFDVAVDHLAVGVAGEVVHDARAVDLPQLRVQRADPHRTLLLGDNGDVVAPQGEVRVVLEFSFLGDGHFLNEFPQALSIVIKLELGEDSHALALLLALVTSLTRIAFAQTKEISHSVLEKVKPALPTFVLCVKRVVRRAFTDDLVRIPVDFCLNNRRCPCINSRRHSFPDNEESICVRRILDRFETRLRLSWMSNQFVLGISVLEHLIRLSDEGQRIKDHVDLAINRIHAACFPLE
mmetsp:Transcript_71900/g.150266  ORF Transcript_71900/g.150266 Transcript_71900/m.150266 type:complete len:327 (-) Transcript_71900:247-1227(-)